MIAQTKPMCAGAIELPNRKSDGLRQRVHEVAVSTLIIQVTTTNEPPLPRRTRRYVKDGLIAFKPKALPVGYVEVGVGQQVRGATRIAAKTPRARPVSLNQVHQLQRCRYLSACARSDSPSERANFINASRVDSFSTASAPVASGPPILPPARLHCSAANRATDGS